MVGRQLFGCDHAIDWCCRLTPAKEEGLKLLSVWQRLIPSSRQEKDCAEDRVKVEISCKPGSRSCASMVGSQAGIDPASSQPSLLGRRRKKRKNSLPAVTKPVGHQFSLPSTELWSNPCQGEECYRSSSDASPDQTLSQHSTSTTPGRFQKQLQSEDSFFP